MALEFVTHMGLTITFAELQRITDVFVECCLRAQDDELKERIKKLDVWLKNKKITMNNINLEELISKLRDVESSINDDTENSTSFMKELDDIMLFLNPKNNIVNVNIKKLHKDAVIPSYAKDGDAGLDMTATEIISETDEDITYGTGLAMEIPRGYVGLVFPRSSIRKYQLKLSNSVGVIDSDYRGEIQATFKKTSGFFSKAYLAGERVCQIIILPYPQIKFNEVQELSETNRGTGGFGSTGL
jgi:dUTP pyrophosphatase